MRRIKRMVGVLAACVSMLGAVACVSGEDGDAGERFGYQVASDLRTTNAGSLEGRSLQAQVLSGRLYPGVYVPGPNGQMIPNTDLVKTQEIPGPERRVKYTLSQEAVFSDGTPVTCSDYLLAFTAGINPKVFGSSMPLFDDTADLQCTPGSKEFTVVFKEGRGARWRGLFEAGTVLPAHAVAAKLGMNLEQLNQSLRAEDPAVLRPIADVWRRGFNLDAFDPQLQVSFGPYKIAGVGEHGEVDLVANEFFYGDAPVESELTVYPGSYDSEQLALDGTLLVGELRDATPTWHDPNAEGNRLVVSTVSGELTDMLVFPEIGPWSDEAKRRAISRCIDPRSVAKAASDAVGSPVSLAPLHVLNNDDPLASRVEDVAQPYLNVDIDAAREASGMELRVAAPYPSERYAAMIASMAKTCEPAGVRIVDVTGEGKTLADLPRIYINEAAERVELEGQADALLFAVDPMSAYPAALNRPENLSVLRAQEGFLWNALPSLPLTAQPVTFAIDRNVGNVVPYTGLSGIGWNMNRWQHGPSHS